LALNSIFLLSSLFSLEEQSAPLLLQLLTLLLYQNKGRRAEKALEKEYLKFIYTQSLLMMFFMGSSSELPKTQVTQQRKRLSARRT